MCSFNPKLIFFLPILASVISPASSIGVNWGTSSSHPLSPAKVVSGILLRNNVSNVKISDADPSVLESLAGSGIHLVIGIPNVMLEGLNSSKKAAASWVHDNVTRYFRNGGLRIEYIAIGDDPFLLSYGQQFHPFVIGAATNIHLALLDAKLSNRVKIIIPSSSDMFYSDSIILPSTARFRDDLNKTMSQLLSFLTTHRSPFVLNINPFPIFQQNKTLSINHFLLQSSPSSHNKYNNFLDSIIDALISSLTKSGFGYMEIMIGRIGWPTDGSANATSNLAQTFIRGFVERMKSNIRTPLRPNGAVIEAYIFSLLDEDRIDVTSGSYERHFGIFSFDGQAKYDVDLGQGSKKLVGAQNVEYLSSKWCVVDDNKDLLNASSTAMDACSNADCSALVSGGSCSGLDFPANISYAFNSYYQQHDQSAASCDFEGMGLMTTVDPSDGNCLFTIALRTSFSDSFGGLQRLLWVVVVSLFFVFDVIWDDFIFSVVI